MRLAVQSLMLELLRPSRSIAERMKPILELLMELQGGDVDELAIVAERLPCVKVHGRFRPVDREAPHSDQIREWLCELGGLLYVDSLGVKPVQWQRQVPELGAVVINAAENGGEVHVRVARVRGQTSLRPRRSLRPPKSMPTAPKAGRTSRESHGAIVIPSLGKAPSITFPAVTPAPESTRSTRSHAKADSQALARLLLEARQRHASDVHVVAGRPLLVRIASELLPSGEPIGEADAERMLMPIVPARLNEVLTRDGAIDFAFDHPEAGRSRVNISRQRTGLKGAFRLIARDIPTIDSLGLPPEIGGAARYHQGLIVLTGPSGHGKTTTLAALVGLINETTSHHILTVEDPVEFVHPKRKAMISQREVGTHTASFAAALKASLREDPDVIVVGELRDTETVRMALSASETGHLVIGTMNTPSAAKTIDRLIDLFPPGDQQQVRMTLAGGLRLVVSQRLLPNKDGSGLVAAAEVLPGTIALWNLIRDNKTYQIPSLQQRGRAAGIVRLDDSLTDLVRDGHTTLEIAQAYSVDAEEFARKLREPAATPAAAPAAASPKRQPVEVGKDLLSRAGALWRKKD
jgi:twitching motility protein PilT